MGDFYNSICVPGANRERVRRSLLRWLAGKGFELSSRPALFDLDGETERCAFLVWNDRWTLLFFSKYEEERRLIRELQTWADPLLYVWVQDSEAWGYDVFDPGGVVASFNSDPRSYRSFGDVDEARPPAAPEEVCRRFGLAGREAELQRIHRRRAIFKEEVCLELCRLFDVEPALTSYDALDSGAFEPAAGWQVEQLLFVHRDARNEAQQRVDLHALALGADTGEPPADGTAAVEISPQVLADIERGRRAPLTLFLLRPLSWLARASRNLRRAVARSRHRPAPRHSTRQDEFARLESSDVIEVRHLINERHGCRIRLPVGGEAKSGSSKPAAVFSFQIGGTPVTCTARPRSRIEEVLQQPNRSKVLRDEKYLIGDLEARHVLFELPPYYLAGTAGPSYLALHVVQTEPALYVFLYRFPNRIVKEVDLAIHATVRSFRLLS